MIHPVEVLFRAFLNNAWNYQYDINVIISCKNANQAPDTHVINIIIVVIGSWTEFLERQKHKSRCTQELEFNNGS